MASAIHTVEASGVGRYMREALWAYPVAEAVHIMGLALLVGSILLVDLRLLGFGKRVPASALVGFAVPWSLLGFAFAAVTGLLMFTAHAEEFLSQRVFMLKMGLILAGGLNAAMLHLGPLQRLAATGEPSGRIRVAAGLSLACWLGVIGCGRLLAYL
jgi:hypothetical protein